MLSDVIGASQAYTFSQGSSVAIGGNRFTFLPINDSVVEYDELFYIDIQTMDTYVYLQQTQLNVTILNDDSKLHSDRLVLFLLYINICL